MKIEVKQFSKVLFNICRITFLWPYKRLVDFRKWGKHDIRDWITHTSTDVVLWIVAAVFFLPVAFVLEWRTRRILEQGKIYKVSGRTFFLPRILTQNNDLMLTEDNIFSIDEQVPKQKKHESEPLCPTAGVPIDGHINLKSGDMIMLVEDPGEGMFGLQDKWIFLHPEGCLIELTWIDHRQILSGITRET